MICLAYKQSLAQKECAEQRFHQIYNANIIKFKRKTTKIISANISKIRDLISLFRSNSDSLVRETILKKIKKLINK
jgi:hypothetical protein